MNTTTHEGTFIGIARSAVDAILGHEAAAHLIEIDHAHMAHGTHWRWLGEQVFTEAGLELIAEKLTALGFVGAATALTVETRQRREACLIGSHSIAAHADKPQPWYQREDL